MLRSKSSLNLTRRAQSFNFVRWCFLLIVAIFTQAPPVNHQTWQRAEPMVIKRLEMSTDENFLLLNIFFPKVKLMEIIGWEASIVTLATHWWATIMLVSDVMEGLEGLSKTSHTGIEQNTCCPIIDAKWNMPQNKWKYHCYSFRLAIFEPSDEPQVGNHRLKCRNGAWSGQFPVCTGDDHDDHDDDDDAVHALVAEPSCLWGTN